MSTEQLEEAHALLSKVVADVGDQLPYRAVVEWWLQANALEADEEPEGEGEEPSEYHGELRSFSSFRQVRR
jgi:hypothetical protein